MPRSHPRSRVAVVLAAVLLALAASVTVASSASAHVSVSSADASAGGFGKLTFRVPNESDTASTVGLRIQIPETAAMASLRVQPVPGWTATLTTADLSQPLESHGQEITSYVSVVEFRATGPGIAPGEFQEFSLSGGPFPDGGELAYPTVQSYSDGTETAWIEPSTGGAEPEHPAPTLTLSAAANSSDAGSSGTTGTDDATHDHGDTQDSPAGLALFLAILALLGAIAAVVLAVRAGRRTVAP